MLARHINPERKFIKHPLSIKMDIKLLTNLEDLSEVNDLECHGLIFLNKICYQKNQIIQIEFVVDDLKFSGNAKVLKSIKNKNNYEIYVEFLQSIDPFQVKMALQICQIKDFLDKKCNESNDNDTALKWIKMNAANF